MEVLQCDGCDFQAPSYEDLKAHIQDVHTAFLQPTDVSEENRSELRSDSMNANNQTETEFSFLKDEFITANEIAGQNTTSQMGTGSYYSQSQNFYGQHMAANPKPTNKFFQCKFCVRYFRSKNLLIEHTRKVHGTQDGGSSVGSHTAGSLNYNIMMHEGFGKVFSCQFCTYKSPRHTRIIKHQKMYHKKNLKESLTLTATSAVSELTSASVPVQEPCKELPEEVVERSILESMVKPLTKSRGNFCCEWCSYETPRRERWCDHMMKKHRSMVKILSCLRQEQDRTSVPDMQNKIAWNASPNSTYISMNMTGCDMLNADVSNFRSSMGNSLIRSNSSISSKFYSVSYPQMKSKLPHNFGMVHLPDRSHYGVADMTNSSADLETSSILNDSSSDKELNEVDSENGLNSVDNQTSGISAKQLMGSNGNKLLETKGIPFRRYMNRFQCPFCPFLTMHRRSISRHIENIHLSGKTTVYKCNECPFTCKSLLKLGVHRQCHTHTTSDWDTVNSQSENIVSSLNDNMIFSENGTINERKSAGMMETVQQQQQQLPQPHLQHPYKCTMCNYSTTTLKGLRVHQQHKHSFCDNLPKYDGLPSNMPQESEADALTSVSTVKKTQTSILGLSSKNNFVAKVTRKVSNDCPLDISPVKKRTRIDEIASNLQSKINQNKPQEDAVLNVEYYEEEEEDEVEIEVELDREEEQTKPMVEVSSSYAPQQMWGRETNDSQKDANFINMHNDYNSTNGAEIELTLSEDEEDYFSSINMKDQQNPNTSVLGSQSNMNDPHQNNKNVEINGSGRRYNCKHCDFSNKSARSVSTHYQRMHPYIKFSFRYILDPNDHSAVYRCLECYIDYMNFEDLQQHYGEHHPEAMNILNSHHSDLIYHCHFCSYTSPNVRSLMPHYQRMHPTVKINNAMIFSSYVVEQQEGLNTESQTLREILNSAPKTMATSTPVAHETIVPASFNKSATKTFSPEYENQKAPSVSSVIVYDCDVCSFASPNMHSVLVHYQKKHPEEKASYFRIQKTMHIESVDRGSALAQMSFEMGVFGHLENASNLKERKVVGYKCKFCVEVHPTLRAICNHLRKHVRYGNVSSVSDTVKGLRSHERSHLALAVFTREDKYSCQYCSFVSAFRHNLDRHMQTHHGHHKPFRCKLCPFKSSYNSHLKTHIFKAHAGEHAYKCFSCTFSTMTISQLKEHSLRVHGKALTLPRPRVVSLSASLGYCTSKKHTSAEEVEDSNDSSYSEPPDVQQQLNHYQSAVLSRNNNISQIPLSGSAAGMEKTEAILNCEFCEFSSGYIQSIRRHYRDKHGGKKLFKCKDCSFYTGFKSAFTMHVEAGHSADPEEGPKDLRCPLCLYHTKYKRNMIDHIVLHREERVVPIEVCRSKLSKYLQGVVFRCDKCTFTCSTDESLQQHIEKHNELKPYKCQLCYYETKYTEELDTHLRDEHKVSRNFELVGRVNLDQLEQMKGKTENSSSDEEEKESRHKTEEREFMMYADGGALEKRFPCEFCGRSFTEGSEWERHVLRHGMALNESKQGTREDSKLKENTEKTVNTLTVEEKENTEKMVVDLTHNSETTASVVVADKSLQETSEDKNE
ncbi:zinc finger protein 462-like isoform X2 [Corapipo altera]|uniref:zinc finger protein 462-like isoform X2 n=1 Tax=Corapipo altera TaxID=415028 RepID=UPI000FD66EC3|nr:zinc finger protein 462-like isoform X2 [Corapipo altera]